MTFIESREKARKTIEEAIKKAMEEFRSETGVFICEVKVCMSQCEARTDKGTRIVDDVIFRGVTFVTDADGPVPW